MPDDKGTAESNPFEGFESSAFHDGVAVAKPAEKTPEPAAEIEEKPAAAVEPEPQAKQEEDTQDDVEEAPKVEERPKPRRSAEERISDLTRARRAAEAERDAFRQRLEVLERAAQPLTQEKKPTTSLNTGAPAPTDYEYGELDPKYIAAVVRHETKQALAAEKQAQEEERRRDADRQEAEKFTGRVASTVKAGETEFEDFVETVVVAGRDGAYPLANDTLQLAVESDVGAKVLYFLATHPKEARDLASKPTERERSAAFGRLEARFASPAKAAEKPQSDSPSLTLPPPIKQSRGAGGKFTPGYDSEDFAAVEARWKQSQRG